MSDTFSNDSNEKLDIQEAILDAPHILIRENSERNSSYSDLLAENSTKAKPTLEFQNNKSKKGPSSCDSCRKKKIKCDQRKPFCGKCLKRGDSCKYTLLSIKLRRPNEYADLLESRIKALEEILKEEKEEKEGTQQTLTTSSANSQEPFTNNSASSLSLPCLKSKTFKETVDHLVEVYFSKVVRYMCLIHPPSFMAQYKEGKASEMVVYSICALAARYSPFFSLLSSKTSPAGRPFADRAGELFRSQLDRAPELSTIQSGLLLGSYEFAAGQGEMAIYFLGITQRAAVYAGINFADSNMLCNPINHQNLTWYELEARRRLWWECLTSDIFSASLVGRPLGIDDRDYVVNLPCDDAFWSSWESPLSSYEYTSSSTDSYYHRFLCILICAWREVFRFTQHRHLRKWFRNNIITRTITALEQPLRDYEAQLPPPLQYQYGLKKEPPTSKQCESAVLNCVHWLIVILLHRSHIAHGISNASISDSELHSRQRCLTAAKQIALVIRDFSGYEDYLLDVFSSFSAFNAATIYLNAIYTEPNNSEAIQHLKLLRQFLRYTASVWAMNFMFLEILRLLDQLFRRRQPVASRDPNQIDWLVPTSTSYLQWYFGNVSPVYSS